MSINANASSYEYHALSGAWTFTMDHVKGLVEIGRQGFLVGLGPVGYSIGGRGIPLKLE